LVSNDPERVAALTNAFRRLGLDEDVDAWVTSELDEGIPQLARYRFLSRLWPKMIDSWPGKVGREPLARRLLDAGVDGSDVAQFARLVAYDTIFAMLYYLEDDGREDCDDLPFWTLVEVAHEEEPRERRMSALFENLLAMDPSGNEGRDLTPPLPGPWNQRG
jgi:hypothetical protein